MNDRSGSPTFDDIRQSTESDRDGEKFDDKFLTNNGFIRTCFNYDLPDGTLQYQSCRYDYDPVLIRAGAPAEKKRFLARRPLHPERFDRQRNIGECVFGTGPRRVLYNWPAIMRAGPGATVIVPEGEKNARDCINRGLLATCVISHDWTEECIAALTGYDLIIPEDADENGRKTAARVQQLLASVAVAIRVVPFDHLWNYVAPEHSSKRWLYPTGDVSDFFDLGGDPAKLIDICRKIEPAGAFFARVHDFPAEEDIKPWDWLYGRHLLRGSLSVTSGASGTGKGSKLIAESLAIVTDRKLLHVAPSRPLRVLIVSLEDDKNTVEKRIAAAQRYYNITKEEVGGRLLTLAKDEMKKQKMKLKFVTMKKGEIKRNEAAIKGIVDFIKRNEIDVVMFDPLRKTHSVAENDNVAMGEVMEVFEDIAEEANCAVHVWHHTRKGNGSGAAMESSRGASAIIDVPRSAEIVDKMTSEEAKKLSIPEGRRRFYFKTSDALRNFAPPVDKVEWFELHMIELRNGSFESGGDLVGVVSPWTPPAIRGFEISSEDLRQIRETIGTEPRWRESIQHAMWVGRAVAQVFSLDVEDDRVTIKSILKTLFAKRVLKTVTARDSARREEKPFVVIVAEPA